MENVIFKKNIDHNMIVCNQIVQEQIKAVHKTIREITEIIY